MPPATTMRWSGMVLAGVTPRCSKRLPGDNLTDIYVAYEQQSGRRDSRIRSGLVQRAIPDLERRNLERRVVDRQASRRNRKCSSGSRWHLTRPPTGLSSVSQLTPTKCGSPYGMAIPGTPRLKHLVLSASGTNRPTVAVAFEGTSGEAVAAYSTTSTTVRFRTWTPGWWLVSRYDRTEYSAVA